MFMCRLFIKTISGTLTDLQMALKNTNYEMNKRLKEFKDLQDAYSKLQEENKIYQKVIESEKSSSLNFVEVISC